MYEWKVYYHLFPNGKYYIGITSSPNIEDRFKNGNGYSTQPVYFAIKKYGWENIEHGLIAAHLTFEEANNFEQLLIQKMNTILPNGYNATYGGEGSKKYTDIDYNNIKEKYLEGYSKVDIQTKFNYGEWIIDRVIDNLNIDIHSKEYKLKRLIKHYNINVNQILLDFQSGFTYDKICERNSCCNTIVRQIISDYFTEEERKEFGKIKQSSTTKMKSVVQLDKDGKYITTFRSSNAAAKAIQGDAKCILNICKHKPNYKTCKGYIFQFEEEYLGGG